MDSSGSSVPSNVHKLAENTSKLMGKSFYSPKICSYAPKQTNSYDCGMYVLAVVEVIVKNYETIDFTKDNFNEITPEYVALKRQEILELIQKLIQEKNSK